MAGTERSSLVGVAPEIVTVGTWIYSAPPSASTAAILKVTSSPVVAKYCVLLALSFDKRVALIVGAVLSIVTLVLLPKTSVMAVPAFSFSS